MDRISTLRTRRNCFLNSPFPLMALLLTEGEGGFQRQPSQCCTDVPGSGISGDSEQPPDGQQSVTGKHGADQHCTYDYVHSHPLLPSSSRNPL